MKDKETKREKIIMPPRDLWKASKEIDGLDAEGSYILAAMRVNKFYWHSDGLYYYEPLKTLDELYDAININNLLFEVGISYKYQMILQLDFECFKSIFQIENEIVPLPGENDRAVGRHAVAVIDKDDVDGSVKFINTWGASWADNGYGSLSKEYMSAHLKEIFLAGMQVLVSHM